MSQDKPVLDRDEIMLFIDDLIVAHPIYTPHLRFLRDLALSALERQYWVGVNFGDGTTRWIRPTPAQINEPPQAGQGDTTAPSHEGHAAGPASGSPDEGKK